MPEWRNWYTRRIQNPLPRVVGSSPTSGTHMKYAPFLLALFLLGTFPAHASIASTSPIALLPTSTVADATVNLYCTLRSDNRQYSTSGSGVFISDRGVILTNAHVAQYFLLANEVQRVKGQCYVRTGSPAQNAYTADVLYFPTVWIEKNAEAIKKKEPKGTGEHDFALLYVTGATSGNALPERFPFVPLSFLVSQGESVTLAGYPTADRNLKDIKRELTRHVTLSTIEETKSFAATSFLPDVFTIASSSAASAGVSGGPVVKGDGSLAGIVSAKSGTTLRAVTVAHMNATMQAAGASLFGTLLGDFAALSQANREAIPGKQLIALREGLLRKR